VRRLLSGNGNGNGFHAKGVLADFVEVAPGYEEVVEEYLKAELDCLVVERHEEARSGISLLKSEGSGRSTFFVTHAPGSGHGSTRSTEKSATVRRARLGARTGPSGQPRLNGVFPPALAASCDGRRFAASD
jgi:chromosome segregation ATPase